MCADLPAQVAEADVQLMLLTRLTSAIRRAPIWKQEKHTYKLYNVYISFIKK